MLRSQFTIIKNWLNSYECNFLFHLCPFFPISIIISGPMKVSFSYTRKGKSMAWAKKNIVCNYCIDNGIEGIWATGPSIAAL